MHTGGGTGYANEETEWEATLKRMGIGKYADLPVESKETQPSFVRAEDVEREQREQRLQKASLEALDELEDDEDEEVLARYRQLRLEQMKQSAAVKARMGNTLPEIGKSQWRDEVTDWPSKVVVLLYKPGDEWCTLLERQLVEVASRFPKVKFVKIVYSTAISNFPESNVPTLLIYNGQEPIIQIVGVSAYGGGANMNADDVEWALAQRGVVATEMEENPRQAKGSINFVRKGPK